jgi:hypothetical protein
VLQWLQYYSIWLSLMAQLRCQVLEGHRVFSWILCGDVVNLRLLIVSTVQWILDKSFYLDPADCWFINAGYFSIGPMGNICQSPTSLSKIPFLLVHLSSLPHFFFPRFLDKLIEHHIDS